MPRRFTFTETVGNADVYIPWTAARNPFLLPWIKLKRGVSLSVVNAEFQSFLNQFKKETPWHFPVSFHVSVQPIVEPYVHRTGRTLVLLFVSVLLLLLIGCANCSILLFARGEARQKEDDHSRPEQAGCPSASRITPMHGQCLLKPFHLE